MRNIHIIPAGTSLGSFSQGAELGPKAMLELGLVEILRQNDFAVSVAEAVADNQRLEVRHPKIREYERLVPWLQMVRHQAQVAGEAGRVLTLGGDHSIAVASLLATKANHPDAVCIYVDAHPDCNTDVSSPTGNLHGMPLTIACGEVLPDQFPGPYFRPDEIMMIGIKDIDIAEAEWISHHAVPNVTMDKIIERGIGEAWQAARDWIAGRPVHVSFDIDSIDSQYAPGTGITNVGGLTKREALYLARQLASVHPVAVDVVELNPSRDYQFMTAQLAVELAASLLGATWSEYDRYLARK